MSKGTKKVIGIIVVVALIVGICYLAYESANPDTVSIGATNEVPNENMGVSNEVNEVNENELTNEVEQNEVVNEVAEEPEDDETQEPVNEENGESEVVTGTNLSREEKAVELAKEYYEEQYGSAEGIYFSYEDVKGDGRYIVTAGTAGSGSNRFFFVNLTTGEVEEK